MSSDRYKATGAVTCNTTYKTASTVIASTLTRAQIDFFNLSAQGTPVGDNILQWAIRRFTTDGTGTATTPRPMDGAAPAAQLTSKTNYTVEPTFTADANDPTGTQCLFDLGVHQRTFYEWVALPGKEIWVPATAGNGVAASCQHASYNGTVNAEFNWYE